MSGTGPTTAGPQEQHLIYEKQNYFKRNKNGIVTFNYFAFDNLLRPFQQYQLTFVFIIANAKYQHEALIFTNETTVSMRHATHLLLHLINSEIHILQVTSTLVHCYHDMLY